ncbi:MULTISPECIES: hypothetical protein [unclassified Haematobacter]|uniref:hypothetical protein n=1 Tax=unclassified Haematobacter TaxID=2640585 RepID=UPI0025B85A5D|nr:MULTISPECIES: hypothetical protein [unclassified Haematobacter]
MVWDAIEHFFYVEGDRIGKKRLDREYQKAISIAAKRSASGEKGGQSRALKKDIIILTNATNLPKQRQTLSPSEKDNGGDARPRSHAREGDQPPLLAAEATLCGNASSKPSGFPMSSPA